MAVVQATKFLGKVVGDFSRIAAACVNWCEMGFVDSLWWSLQIQ